MRSEIILIMWLTMQIPLGFLVARYMRGGSAELA